MTYRQIEAAREVRLWIGQVIMPVATVLAVTMAVPEVRKAVATKAKDVKESIKRNISKCRFKKVEES